MNNSSKYAFENLVPYFGDVVQTFPRTAAYILNKNHEKEAFLMIIFDCDLDALLGGFEGNPKRSQKEPRCGCESESGY